MNFEAMRNQANETEAILCGILEEKGCKNVTMNLADSYEARKTHDISWQWGNTTYTGELKEDYMADMTGNVAIEIEWNGKESGITDTRAHYWFTKLADGFWACKVKELREWIKKNRPTLRVVRGGDRGASVMILIPVPDFLTINTKL
jgi:hypothetical protein